MYNEQPKIINLPLTLFKGVIWALGALAWLYGVIDRAVATFGDGKLSLEDDIQLGTVAFFFVSWLLLRPKLHLDHDSQFLARSNYIQTLNELKNSKFN